MKKNLNKIIFSGIWIILSLLCVVYFCLYYVKFDLNYVTLIIKKDDYNIVVDDNNIFIRIMKTNSSNKIISEIKYQKISDDKYHQPISLIQDGNDWYLCDFFNTLGVVQNNYDIYKLDFENKHMEKTASNGDDDIYDALNIKNAQVYDLSADVTDGKVYITAEVYIDKQIPEYYKFDISGNKIELLPDNVSAPLDISLDSDYYAENSNGKSSDKYRNLYTDSDESLNCYGLNLTKKSLEKINPDLSAESVSKELDKFINKSVTFSSIKNVYINNEKSIAVSYFNDNESGIIEYDGNNIKSYNFVYTMYFWEAILFSVLIMALVFVSELVLYKYIKYLYTAGSLISKIISALIPAMIVCDIFAVSEVEKILDKMDYNSLCDNMSEIGMQIEATGFAKKFIIENDESEVMARNFIYNISSNNIINNQYDINSADRNDIKSKYCKNVFYELEFIGYNSKSGELKGIFSSYNGLNCEDVYEPSYLALLKSAVENDSIEVYNGYDLYNQLLTYVIYPCTDENGKVNSLLVINASKTENDNNSSILLINIAIFEIIISGFIILTFSVITYISAKPLKRLRKQAVRLTNGETDCFVKIPNYYADEVTEISVKFNELAKQTGENFDELNNMRNCSKAYFPENIFKIIDRKNIVLLKFNENVTRPLYVIYLKFPEKYGKFDLMSSLISDISDKIEECNGFIGEISAGFMAIFAENSSLFNLAASLQTYGEMSVIFDYTNINIRIVGGKGVYRFSILPENQVRYQTLLSFGESADADFIITDSAGKQRSENIFSRCIGMVDSEYIYEVTSGTGKQLRKLTRSYMKNGVDLYFRGEYRLARNMFINVLRYDSKDKTAQYYISLIDSRGIQ